MLPGLIPSQNTYLKSTFLGILNSVATTSIVDMGNFTVPHPGLAVVLFFVGQSNVRVITNITIGATTGTPHITVTNANTHRGALYSRIVSSGSNNITVNMTSTSATATMTAACWLLTGYSSTAPFATDVSTAATLETTFAVPSPAISMWGYSQSLGTTGATWSSATTVGDFLASLIVQGYAQRVTVASETSHVETITMTSGKAMIGASWR